jgi:sorbose reductase
MSIEECAPAREGFPRPVPPVPQSVFEQFRLNDKVAVVTGAAEGIGLAAAEAFAEAGANIAMWYNSWVLYFETMSVLGSWLIARFVLGIGMMLQLPEQKTCRELLELRH